MQPRPRAPRTAHPARPPDPSTPHPPPTPTDNILFSSNFFSAHTASEALLPASSSGGRRSATDAGGWDKYGADWTYYYECMLAPVARQTASACPGWPRLMGGRRRRLLAC